MDAEIKQRTMRDVLIELMDVAQNVALHFSNLDKADLPALLRSYKLLVENKEMLDDISKIINGLQQSLSYEVIPNAMQNVGVDSIKLVGRTFSIAGRMHASIPVETREAAFIWLKENGFSELIQPNVNVKTLSSAMSQYFEENAKLPPADIIKAHKQLYIQMRKA